MTDKRIEVQRHGTMYLFSAAGITLIGFFATIFYAHWLGPEILGQYTLFLSFFAITCLFTDLGVGYAATYRICEGTDPDAYFTANLVIRLLLFIVVSLVLVLFSSRLGNISQTGLLPFLIIALGVSTLTTSITVAISASNRLGLAASVSLIDNLVRIFVQIIAVFLGFRVYGLAGGLIAGLLTEILVLVRFIDYKLKKFTWSHIRNIFSFSTWIFLSNMCTILFENANILIISYFMPLSDVGIYGVCWTFSAFALFVSNALCNTLYVKVSRWNSDGDKDSIVRAFSQSASYALIFAIPIFAGGIILGKDLLYYLYGSSFAAGAFVLIIIIGGRIFQSIFQLFSNFLMATDQVRKAFYALTGGILVNILLSVTLVPTLGLSGAALGTFANVIISSILGWFYLREKIKVTFEKRTILHILYASAVMTGVISSARFLIPWNSALISGLLVITGAAIYCGVLLAIDSQIREDALRTLKIQWLQ